MADLVVLDEIDAASSWRRRASCASCKRLGISPCDTLILPSPEESWHHTQGHAGGAHVPPAGRQQARPGGQTMR
jgi:hypothetical protein